MSTCGECRWYNGCSMCARYPKIIERYSVDMACGEFSVKDNPSASNCTGFVASGAPELEGRHAGKATLVHCPFCGSLDVVVVPLNQHSYVALCYDCCAHGPEASGKEDALVAWNERSQRACR